MKNFFKKIKSYGFWVSLASALVILFTAFGKAFGFSVENKVVEDCVMSVAGVLAVFGIVSMSTGRKSDEEELDECSENEEKKEDEMNDEENKTKE